jgi:hypothetical protein
MLRRRASRSLSKQFAIKNSQNSSTEMFFESSMSIAYE